MKQSYSVARDIVVPLIVTFFLSAPLLGAGPKSAQQIQWIQFINGKLDYGTDAYGNRVPDFSTAGYEGGGVAVPDIPVLSTLDPVKEGDDTPRIQAAIDTLTKQPLDKNGFRGAVLLHAGVYRIAGTVDLNASGIVLRGASSDKYGTILIAQGLPHTIVRIGGTGSWQHAGPTHAVLDEYVPIGATTLTVDDDHDLKVGDRVIVQWYMTPAFIHIIGMDQIPPRKDGRPVRQWEPGMSLKFDREILAITGTAKGERITLDAPLTNAMDRSEGVSVWRYAFPGRIAHVGVENLSSDGRAFEKMPRFGDPRTLSKGDDPHFADGHNFHGWLTTVTTCAGRAEVAASWGTR